MKTALAIAFTLAVFSYAMATASGDVYVVDGLALKGHDPVAYFVDGKPVRGMDEFRHQHAGATYRFANAANRDAFAAQPDKYAPQYGGYCAFGVSRGYKADIDPAAFSIVDAKLYVNYNEKVRADWSKERGKLIGIADARWDEVRKTDKVLR